MIKFRVWDATYPKYLDEEFAGTLQLRLFSSNFYIFEQFTGVKCGGGYDVYVGDILFDGYEYYVVEYDYERVGYTMRGKSVVDSLGNIDSEFMVIGNINENGELLKNE